MKTLEVQGKSEWALQAALKKADMFVYVEGNKSCHFCLEKNAGRGVAEVHSSQPVYVQG